MKKKSPRGIPDFSSKRIVTKKLPDAQQPRGTPTAAPTPPAAPTKPWSTSAKSGRRGG